MSSPAALRPGPAQSWPADRITGAIEAFHRRHGRAPRATDFVAANGLPSTATVAKRCGTVTAAIAAAGIAPNPPGRPRRTTRDRPSAGGATAAAPEPPVAPLSTIDARTREVLRALVIVGDGATVRALGVVARLPAPDVEAALHELAAAGYARTWAWEAAGATGENVSHNEVVRVVHDRGPGICLAHLHDATQIPAGRLAEILAALERAGHVRPWSWAPTAPARTTAQRPLA